MANKLWIDLSGNNPKVLFQETQPDLNYVDYTNSIEKWYNYGLYVKDYNYIRNVVLSLVVAIAQPDYSLWDDLTLEQKQIACYYIVAPYALRVPDVVSDADDKINWRRVLELTQGNPIQTYQGRQRIFQEMRIYVGEYIRTGILSLSDSQDFYKSVYELASLYVNANTPNFKYWINNTVGTPYENDGFAQKTYYSVDILNGLNSIYNGDY